jgi:hypothetical protein
MARKKKTNDNYITKEWMEGWLARRDAIFANPTYEAAMEFWDYGKMGVPTDKEVVLAGVHKARIHWPDATEEQRVESRAWLADNGFKELISIPGRTK